MMMMMKMKMRMERLLEPVEKSNVSSGARELLFCLDALKFELERAEKDPK